MVTILTFDGHSSVLFTLMLENLSVLISTKVGVVRIGDAASLSGPLVLHKDLVLLKQREA